MSTPYATYTRQFTARLQARMHKQSYANVMQHIDRHCATPTGGLADARMHELKDLVQQHRRTFDPSLRAKALSILQTLPLKSTDEDPHFRYTFAGLQACAHFGAVNTPTTFNFLNHVTRHTFLLDGHSIFLFHLTLLRLHHPQTTEIAQILLPRIRQVVDDFSVSEARLIMEFLAAQKALDAELARSLVAVMRGGLPDMSVVELACCVSSVHVMGSAEVAREFLTAAAPRIGQALRESVAQRHYYKSLYFAEIEDASLLSSGTTHGEGTAASAGVKKAAAARASKAQMQAFLLTEQKAAGKLLFELPRIISYLSWGPRRVLNEIVRTAIAWTEPATMTPFVSRPSSDEGAAEFGSSGAQLSDTISEAERRDHEDYLQALPQLGRRQLGVVFKALHFASHRHLAGLRILSARIAASAPEAPDAASALARDDLPLAIETVAYFYATDCIPSVLAIVEEVQTSQLAPINAAVAERVSSNENILHLLTQDELKTVEVIALRTLLSCTRLLSACNVVCTSPASPGAPPSGRPVDPETTRELCKHIAALTTSPLLQLYLDYARLLGRQEAPRTRNATRRQLAGAAHVLHSITVLFQFVTGDSKAEDFVARASTTIDAASLEKMRANLRDLTQLVQMMAEKNPGNLMTEIVVETRAALTTIQKHPEWLPNA